MPSGDPVRVRLGHRFGSCRSPHNEAAPSLAAQPLLVIDEMYANRVFPVSERRRAPMPHSQEPECGIGQTLSLAGSSCASDSNFSAAIRIFLASALAEFS